MESATWCRTQAADSAARRLRPEVWKNASTALSSNEGELARSITTCVPAMASLRPWPVMVLTPVLGEAATTSWPPWRRMATVFEPIRPVPPMTTIFMVYPPLSTTGDPLRHSAARRRDSERGALRRRRSAGGGHKLLLTTLSTSNATPTRMSRICSARHGDGARVVVDCRCPKAATHWPWVAGVADPKNPMVGRFAGCCASAVSGHAARDAGRLLRCGISAGLCPLMGEHAMSQQLSTTIAVIGVDIGKNSFHVVGLDQCGD